jgi:TolA-binding protein
VRRLATLGLGLVTLGLAGCAQQADLIQQERRMAQQMSDQRKQIQALQREVERLRGDMDGTGPRRSDGVTVEERLQDLEARLARLEGKPPPSHGTLTEPSDDEPPLASAPRELPPRDVPPPPPPPPPPPADDAWARDVSRDQQAIEAGNAPERGELVPILDSVAKKDCGRAVGQLNTFAAQKKESPLASTALYWSARCHALKGDKNQAITKFYDVVTKYPRGSKAPAALWEQGNLFIEMGDTPDARLALGKLIKDYPNSDEAGRARRRLTELDR